MSVLGAVLSQSFEEWIASTGGHAYRKSLVINETVSATGGPYIWYLESDGDTDIPLVWDLHEDTVPANAFLSTSVDYGTGNLAIVLSTDVGFTGGLVEATPAAVFLPVRDMTNPL